MTDNNKYLKAGPQADALIADEIARQDKMWGVANERADSELGQLAQAAAAQLMAIVRMGWNTANMRAVIFDDARAEFYPGDWSGFRDYGSDVANLVVAAAYIRQEIKRRIAKGESTHRTSRNPQTQPYTGDQPNEYTK